MFSTKFGIHSNKKYKLESGLKSYGPRDTKSKRGYPDEKHNVSQDYIPLKFRKSCN